MVMLFFTAIAMNGLLAHVKALGNHELEVIFRPGHRHIKQAAFLLDLRGRAGAHVGGNASIDHIEDMHSIPLLAFGRVNG